MRLFWATAPIVWNIMFAAAEAGVGELAWRLSAWPSLVEVVACVSSSVLTNGRPVLHLAFTFGAFTFSFFCALVHISSGGQVRECGGGRALASALRFVA